MSDGEFAAKARDAAKVVGGTQVEVRTDPTMLGVRMTWRGKQYEMSVSRTGDAELDDRSKVLVLDAVRRHGKPEAR